MRQTRFAWPGRVWYTIHRHTGPGCKTCRPGGVLFEKEEVACMKLLVKLLAVIAALSAVAAAVALLLEKEQRPEYISIYDHDEDEIPF